METLLLWYKYNDKDQRLSSIYKSFDILTNKYVKQLIPT